MKALPILLLVACGGHIPADRAVLSRKDSDAAARDLSASERKTLDANGFAILASGETPSFHVGYTALFHAHQPVYITADSLLYAWHSSYDTILMQLEQDHLIKQVTDMLVELREHLASSTAPAESRADVDVYLAVAHTLITGRASPPVAGGDAAAIAALVDQGTRADGQSLELFGKVSHFDFSMLKPRGHYSYLVELQQYFRAMSWLGRVELRIAERRSPRDNWTVDHRVFEDAKLLASLFTPQTRHKWDAVEATIGAFVGPPDSMSLPGLATGLARLGTSTRDRDIAAVFEKLSTQKIRTQMQDRGAGDIAFVTLGQRFVFDSQVFTEVTYGNLQVERMMPSPLDVAYAVFHNTVAKALLGKDLGTYGSEYGNALETIRRRSTENAALWRGSLYHTWLLALRALSPDTGRDATLPAPLTSEAWARRMLNTQLASWAELRHDNILYAKQSFTAEAACAYPAAYVDPYPAFYAAMEMLAARGKATIEKLPFHDQRDAKLVAYFDNLRATMAKLHGFADKERSNQELTDDDIGWINHMVSIDGRSGGCTMVREPGGWYADLYYDRAKILYHEPIIADVHTQPTDEVGNRVGRVLHVGTGFPHLLVARIEHDGGTNRQTYRGYVSTFSQLVTENFQRLDDDDWRTRLEKEPPPPVPWLDSLIAR